MGIFEDLRGFLEQMAGDPVVFSLFFFLYAIAAAIFLPIPVEFALFLSPETPYAWKAIVLGAGKAVGSVLVFYIGFELEAPIRRWSQKWNFFKKFVDFCEWLIHKLHYVGLFILLSIPFMSDTVVLYVFSLFNKEGKDLNLKWFALVNFLAGLSRATIIFYMVEFLGWDFGW